MAQAASITVNDRAASPAAHTFAPRDVTTDLATFVEAASTPIGERKLTISKRKSGTKYRIRVRLENPVLVTEVINGVNRPTVPRTAFADVTFTFDETSSLQERKDTVGMFANALAAAQTMVDSSVTGLEGIW